MTQNDQNREYFLKIPLSCPIRDNTEYKFEIDNSGDNKKYCIYINRDKNCKAVLEMNSYNQFKCNWIHKQFWVHKEPLAAWALIVSAISLIVSIITLFV